MPPYVSRSRAMSTSNDGSPIKRRILILHTQIITSEWPASSSIKNQTKCSSFKNASHPSLFGNCLVEPRIQGKICTKSRAVKVVAWLYTQLPYHLTTVHLALWRLPSSDWPLLDIKRWDVKLLIRSFSFSLSERRDRGWRWIRRRYLFSSHAQLSLRVFRLLLRLPSAPAHQRYQDWWIGNSRL